MKIERLSQDKIRIFLTFDDLTERGIKKEDMWKEIPKVHALFSELMDQAYTELGFDASGPLAVEVFAMPAQGMVVIVTRGQVNEYDYDVEDDENLFELEVTMEQSDIISYSFKDFEDLVSACKAINTYLVNGGTIFHFKEKYILQLDPIEMDEERYETMIAILSEYGNATSITREVLEEYGKIIVSDDAVKVICTYF